ncbi:Hypothetical predicted protein [Pelobates cultripes]|uniref:Uncharacterized protein n=1 Tax=Pelobates cultripes TaxID=61616 RepID=A0AAD1S507_PELCU|nr:Hypothetical predicted protein [Pelobates cultripes]
MAPTGLLLESAPASPAHSENSSCYTDPGIKEIVKTLPSRMDLAAMLEKHEATFHTRLEGLETEAKQVSHWVQELEEDRDMIHAQIQILTSKVENQSPNYAYMQRSLDDIDNRGCRNNLRIRGLPETGGEDLPAILPELFNLILGKAADMPILFDRAHRSLKLRNTADTHRNIVCRLHYFTIKDEINDHPPLIYHGHEIQVFPDLSWLTLNARRSLKPITDQLRATGTAYAETS